MTAQTPEPAPQEDGLKETIRTIIFAMVIALMIRTLAFEPFNIPSSSMVPTLLIGDYLFVSKFSYGYGNVGTFWGMAPFGGRVLGAQPHRGDVVVFKVPRDNATDYIKRLIGLPGDTVQMRQGILYINGVPVDREKLAQPQNPDGLTLQPNTTDYLEHLPNGPTHIIRKEGDDMPLDNTDVFVVPPHHYFFMGDNRDNSQDSRTTTVGFVPETNLVGKAEFLFFSLDEGVHFWEIWKWPTSVRWHRLFTKID
ncbi:MAG TPA: signal peptidase I [Alphaproteobacteria bacterium]|nr:signal peptidase I [Alphaproteobacteria bacterium]